MAELLRTPLYDFHAQHGGRMVPFAGYEMPVQYTGILQEHLAVRKAAGLFDVSHMGEARVLGPRALDFLNYVATNDIDRVADGAAIYTPLCYDNGGVVDDVIIYRINAQDFLIVLNAANKDKDIAWLRKHTQDFDCVLVDESPDWAQLALQGPAAFAILEAAGFYSEVEQLKRFRFLEMQAHDVNCGNGPLLVSRTGYTGEDGVELYCQPEAAVTLARRLYDAGTEHGLLLAGLGCRDSLRLEAGLPLYGHEIDETITPLEAGLGWTVKLDKERPFIGQAMLEAQKQGGAPRRMVHFVVEGRRIARQGSALVYDGREAGTVVSGTQSAVLEQPIGSALVRSEVPNDGLCVDIRGQLTPLTVKKPPLHKL